MEAGVETFFSIYLFINSFIYLFIYSIIYLIIYS